MTLAVTKWDGRKISQPGLYSGVDMASYHGDLCDSPSISSTGLRTIDLQTPLHYWDSSPFNPDRHDDEGEAEEKQHFRLGRAAHSLLLEPETYRLRYVTRPEEWKNWQTHASQAWRKTQVANGRTVLSDDEEARVLGMVQRLQGHSLHADGILSGAIELSVVWKDARTGVWLKARPDAVPTDAATLTDLKCMSDPSPRGLEGAIRRFGYDMQIQLAAAGLAAVAGLEIEEFVIVAIGAKRPHAIHIATLSDASRHWAQLRLRRSIDRFAHGLRTGEWPGYDRDDGRVYFPARWDVEQWTDLQKTGEMPEEP